MAVSLSLFAGAGAQFFDNNGVPLAGGKVYSYVAGTTTPQVTYTSNTGSIPHANPIVFDAGGRVPSGGEIWLTNSTAYKFALFDSANVLIATYDNIPASDSITTLLAQSSGASLIGFIQAGGGAVASTVETELRNNTVTLTQFGADPTGNIDATENIKNAILAAKTYGKRVVGSGTYRISDKIVINCAFDGSDMTFNVYGTPTVAVEVSTGNGTNPTDIFTLNTELGIILPSVINMTKPSVGWAGQGIGVRYVNVQNMKITERLVENFAIGIQATSYAQGCGYNTIQGGYLRNNGVNRQITVGDATGFTNRWDYYGGRYFHSSAEGVEVPGVFHVDLVPNSSGNIINDHNFFGASLEGNAEQYHARVGANFVTFFGCRWESTAPGGVKVHLAYAGVAGQGSCSILNGRGAAETTINITQDAGAAGRVTLHSQSNGGLISVPNAAYAIQNTSSSNNPTIVSYAASTNPFTSDPLVDYAGFFGSVKIGGKRQTDAYDRIYLDINNGNLYFGSGSVAANQFLTRVGTAGIGAQNCGLSLQDGISAPGTVTGWATLYVDVADGDLKIKFGDGTVKTIATNP